MLSFPNRRDSALLATAAIVGTLYPGYDAYAQTVSDHVLSDVRADVSEQCAVMTIEFNSRFQLLSYFPQTSGNELHIRLQPLDDAPLQRESLRAPTSVPSVTSIMYEGDNAAGPALSLTFSHNVHFKVTAGEKPQTIVISVSDARAADSCLAVPVPMSQPVVENLGNDKAQPTVASQKPLSRPGLNAPPGLYIINLMSQPGDIGDLAPAKAAKLSGHIAYESRFEKDAQSWHRLRLGFYENWDQAQAALKALHADFPDAWVTSVSEEEREQGVATQIALAGAVQPLAAPPVSTVPLTAEQKALAAKLEADTEIALKAGETDRAIQLLTNALTLPQNEHSARAHELLGLTRERKGQIAHAKAEYEEYIRLYPDGEGAARVRQRLAALVSPGAQSSSGLALRQASGGAGKASSARGWRWGMRGSFSQYYYYDRSSVFQNGQSAAANGANSQEIVLTNQSNLNLLQNTGDLTISGGNDRTQVQLRAAGSYSNNFAHGGSTTTILNGVSQIPTNFLSSGVDTKSLSALYFDYSDRVSGLQIRLGRQSRNSQGVFGRFDGGLVSYQASPKLKFNVVSGFPVNSSTQLSVQSDRPFYGMSADYGAKKDKFQASLYAFDQENSHSGGLIDRRSVGLEARYFTPKFNAYTIVDYDVKFNKLNLGIVTFNYTAADLSSISITADYRQSPFLTTHNVFAGGPSFNNVPLLTLAELRAVAGLSNDQIYQLAMNNTYVSKSFTLAYSRPISKKLQSNVDFSITDTGGSLGANGIGGLNFIDFSQPQVGKEYFFGGQLIGSGFLWKNDIYILSGRYADTQNNHTYVGDFNARVPVSAKLRVSPRIRYSYRTDKIDAGTNGQLQPSFRANWYPMRHAEVELEGGAYFNHTYVPPIGVTPSNNTSESGLLVNIGYRLDF